MSEKVQLAAGLDENKNLTEAAQQRGLACLARFVGRLGSVQPNRLKLWRRTLCVRLKWT